MTAYLIWLEIFFALQSSKTSFKRVNTYPSATAIISAYLPNEVATVAKTIDSLLHMKYPGKFQVIFAYNTPHPLAFEKKLLDIAAQNPHFLPLCVKQSNSKAQNINTALPYVEGKFVGIFDADHQPDPQSFTHAWKWLANGYDVVQGHCVIRNGNESFLAKMVSVEFEIMYAMSHVGRNRLHGFGIFGGSNGYWKTSVLRSVQMDSLMLTEDIDSSMRAINAGYKIVTDPRITSEELSPVTLGVLWNQRMRWAQGWVQVSLKHFLPSLFSPHLSVRQKLGIFHLLGWREIYPWISMQIIPLLAFWTVKYHGLQHLSWVIPVFVFTTIFTQITGPAQIFSTYTLSTKSIKKHKAWFFFYFLFSFFFYAGVKNLINIVAQVKEVLNERDWKITPRTLNRDIFVLEDTSSSVG